MRVVTAKVPSDAAFSVLPAIICLDNQRFQSVHILASAVPSYLFSRSGSTDPAPRLLTEQLATDTSLFSAGCTPVFGTLGDPVQASSFTLLT